MHVVRAVLRHVGRRSYNSGKWGVGWARMYLGRSSCLFDGVIHVPRSLTSVSSQLAIEGDDTDLLESPPYPLSVGSFRVTSILACCSSSALPTPGCSLSYSKRCYSIPLLNDRIVPRIVTGSTPRKARTRWSLLGWPCPRLRTGNM